MIKLVDAVKWGIELLVSVGTGVVLGNVTGKAVKNAKGVEKVCAAVAAVAIEGLVATKASGYLCDQVDDLANRIEARMESSEEEEGGTDE